LPAWCRNALRETRSQYVRKNISKKTVDLSAPHSSPGVWSQVHDEGVQLLENITNIRVPVIAAIEGRAHVHYARRVSTAKSMISVPPNATATSPAIAFHVQPAQDKAILTMLLCRSPGEMVKNRDLGVSRSIYVVELLILSSRM
jgi:hypothetical protein